MHLRPPPDPTEIPRDLASGLRAAVEARGFRPAVTVLWPERRDEQGFATLAQWTAKGAHLLEAELMLTPGDRVHVDAPAGWPLAAVCLAAWWAGVAVTVDGGCEVAVVDASRAVPDGAVDLLRVGPARDGAPTQPTTGTPWAQAVQTWPDVPPRPHAAPDLLALVSGPRRWTQAELLADAAALGDRAGPLGLDAAAVDAITAILAVAVRPVATGQPTVVLAGATRGDAAGDRVRSWLP